MAHAYYVGKFVACGNKLPNICIIIHYTYYFCWVNYFSIECVSCGILLTTCIIIDQGIYLYPNLCALHRARYIYSRALNIFTCILLIVHFSCTWQKIVRLLREFSNPVQEYVCNCKLRYELYCNVQSSRSVTKGQITYVCTYVNVLVDRQTHTYVCTHIHMHIHTHTYTYTYFSESNF